MTNSLTEPMTEDAVFELLSLERRVDSVGTVYYHNKQGYVHRVYGPAIEWSDGYRAWFINGIELTEAEWRRAVASMETV